MEYFSLLHMEKEPFSNSPDPDFFFSSTQHVECLQRLELAIRLRQGLNVVIGDVGLGKSTLCRQLLRRLSGDHDLVRVHLILDPGFTDEREFVGILAGTLGLGSFAPEHSVRQVKAAIKDFLLTETLEKKRITALCIDEGQKLPGFCLEILREFLNFETNSSKLLQIVIFAQEEFRAQMLARPNFTDRIANFFQLTPLGFFETRAMVRFRLEKAGADSTAAGSLFSSFSLLLLYLITGGSPRKIVMVCSKALLALIIHRKKRVNGPMMLAATRRHTAFQGSRQSALMAGRLAVAMVLALALASFWVYRRENAMAPGGIPAETAVADAQGYEERLRAAILAGDIKPATGQPERFEGADLVGKEGESGREVPSPGASRPENSPPSPLTPKILGSVRVRQGESLSKMIARVYGRFTPERLAKVLAVNPGLPETGHLTVDTAVDFPWLDDHASADTRSGFHVLVGQWRDFGEAYRQLFRHPETAPPLRLLPVLDRDSSVRYRIFLEKVFVTREEAEAARGRLEGDLGKEATILEGKAPQLMEPSARG